MISSISKPAHSVYAVISLILVVSLAGTALSDPPSFTSPQDIYCAGERIDVGTCASPCIADWNGDGLNDLIVGQWGIPDDGRIRLYVNSNTNDSPIYTYFTYMQSDGTDINLSYG